MVERPFCARCAGRLQQSKYLRIKGAVRYNGLAPGEFTMARAVALVDQVDRHIPNLTVRETLKFAYKCQARSLHDPLNPSVVAAHAGHVPAWLAGDGLGSALTWLAHAAWFMMFRVRASRPCRRNVTRMVAPSCCCTHVTLTQGKQHYHMI